MVWWTKIEDPTFSRSLLLPSVLADSGAAMNFLHPTLFDQLAKDNTTYKTTPKSVMLGDESTTTTNGSIDLLMQFTLVDITITIRETFHRLKIHYDAVLSNPTIQSSGIALYFADPHPDKRLFKALYGKQDVTQCKEDELEGDQEVFPLPNPIADPI